MTCPSTGEAVPTGHRTPELKMATPDTVRSFRCPRCNQIHSWAERDAVVEGAIPAAGYRQDAA